LLDTRFTVADAYLFVTLRWARRFDVTVPPALAAYGERILERDHVRAALAEEGLLERAEIPAYRRAG
jgi:glutathione S-transferase